MSAVNVTFLSRIQLEDVVVAQAVEPAPEAVNFASHDVLTAADVEADASTVFCFVNSENEDCENATLPNMSCYAASFSSASSESVSIFTNASLPTVN